MTKATDYSRIARDKDIAELYLDGLYSQRELAELYQVSRSTVRRAVEQNRGWYEEMKRGPAGRPTDYDMGQPMYDEESARFRGYVYNALAVVAAAVMAGTAGAILYMAFN
jgi:DNA-binding transcriptional MocR family regulator